MAGEKLGRAAAVVGLAIAVGIVSLSIVAMFKYSSAADAATVLAVVVGPLAGLGAAAFGIKLGADANAENRQTKHAVREVEAEVRGLFETRREEVRTASPAGQAELETGMRSVLDRLENIGR
jgi:hypothetical protein